MRTVTETSTAAMKAKNRKELQDRQDQLDCQAHRLRIRKVDRDTTSARGLVHAESLVSVENTGTIGEVDIADWRTSIINGFAAKSIIKTVDLICLFIRDDSWRIFRDCSPKAQELLAESVIGVMIVDGLLTPLGIDTYLVDN